MKIPPASRASFAVALMLMLTTILAGCGLAQATTPTSLPGFTPRPTPGGGQNSIEVTSRDFSQHAITITHGSAVVFVVRLDSGPHILCLGRNGHCDPSQAGPRELRQNGGFSVDAGQSLTVTFDQQGVFPITCAIYPSMNLVVTVQ